MSKLLLSYYVSLRHNLTAPYCYDIIKLKGAEKVMPKTISFHSGTSWSRGHNIRDKRYIDKQEHIDQTLTENNVVVCDIPVRQAYDDIFGQAVQEYNSKQKRSDRKIDSYYDKIKKDKRKNPVYECIVQIGDKEDTGNSAELEKQALLKYAKEWNIRNPHLSLVGAYIHADEPNGTVHLHVDYIPVAECSKGLKLQNSYDKALQQQGFKSTDIHHTAQIAWQNSEREALSVICKDLGIDAQHNQGVTENRPHLSKTEYIREKKKIEDELKPLKEELDEYRELDVSANDFVVEKQKLPFVKKVSVPVEDIEQLEEQAKAYRVNRQEIDTPRTRKKSLDEREQELDGREKQLDERSEQIQQHQEIVRKNNQIVMQMYERQKSVNQLLEQSEHKVSSLTSENSVLTAQLAESEKTITGLQEQLETALQTIRGAYESVANIVKAVGMLKYDKEDGYKVELTAKQSRLIDAIARYGARWAKEDGHPDLAKTMEEKIGISKGIQENIQALTPKVSRGRGL